MGLKDGSVIKKADCSSRGPEFHAWHLTLSAVAIPRNSTLSSGTEVLHTDIQTQRIRIKEKVEGFVLKQIGFPAVGTVMCSEDTQITGPDSSGGGS